MNKTNRNIMEGGLIIGIGGGILTIAIGDMIITRLTTIPLLPLEMKFLFGIPFIVFGFYKISKIQ